MCTNAVWADWRDTAVTIRDLVIKTRGPGSEESTARRLWLRAWSSSSKPADVLALQTEADPDIEKLRWEKDPGMLWWKPRLYAMSNYAVRGAKLLKSLDGQDLLEEGGPPIANYFRAATIGAALTVLGGGALYYYSRD